jgi:tetratricopeptide (TPR) repeat protein
MNTLKLLNQQNIKNRISILSIFFFLTFICQSVKTHAQPSDNEDAKLAAHYYSKGEFASAEEYYQKLFKKYQTKSFFEKYYDCLVFQEKYKEAEKVVEKQIKAYPYEISYQFNLANVYKNTDRAAEAEALYQKLIDELSPVQSQVQSLGRYFSGIGAYEYALQTYEKGRKSNKNGYQFNLEVAELYAMTNQFGKMIDSYLDLLEYSSGYLKTVQAYLVRQIDFDTDTEKVELLRLALLKRAQSNPTKTYYNQMLIWYYIQKEEYAGAIIQSKALDQKQSTRGRHTFEMGEICQSNRVYDKAKQAYEYVKSFGENSPYYTLAAQNILEVSFLQVTESGIIEKEKINAVLLEFESELTRLGKQPNTLQIMERLARIYAFYVNEPGKAISLLNEAMKIAPTAIDKARVKVLLGDVLVTDNQIWEASIFYMQVANDFKDDKIGHEAKFKNAKVFYYDGEFDYAKAQLDVLKASTTKLIANDAMQLSLLLQDNLGVDTTEAPVQLFAKADLLLQQNRYEEALTILDSIKVKYPFHSLSDEILFQKGIIYSKQSKWPEAASFFEAVVTTYAFDILADDAIFRLAEIYDYRLNDPEKAAMYYKRILFDFSGSLYTAIARERYRALKSI